MISIIGATGTTGSEITRQLTEAGEQIRIVARNPDKVAALKNNNVDVIGGDLERPETIEAALRGADRSFIVSSVNQNFVRQIENFIDAAKRVGVKQIVKLSAMGALADSPSLILRMHAETDKMLGSSGLSYTILQPNTFFQNLLWFTQTIKTMGMLPLPMQNARQSLVDVRDIGAVAVKTLTAPGHENKTYVITGPEPLSYKEVAEKLSAVIGKKVSYVDISPDSARDGMLKAGMPEWDAAAITEIYTTFATGNFSAVTDTVTRVTGRQPITFEQFARDHVAAFQ